MRVPLSDKKGNQRHYSAILPWGLLKLSWASLHGLQRTKQVLALVLSGFPSPHLVFLFNSRSDQLLSFLPNPICECCFFSLSLRLVRAITLTSIEYCTGLEGELRVVLCLTRVHRLGFPAGDTEKWRQSVNWRSSERDYGTVQSEHQVCMFILSQAWNSRKGPAGKMGRSTSKRSWTLNGRAPQPLVWTNQRVKAPFHGHVYTCTHMIRCSAFIINILFYFFLIKSQESKTDNTFTMK